ncbi:MAG: hypothetical protein RLW62_14320, partial [Gammaproteobacteria bacterium]
EFPRLDGAGTLADRRESLRLAGVPVRNRDAYAARFAARGERLTTLAREHRMLHATVSTLDDPLTALLRMLAR